MRDSYEIRAEGQLEPRRDTAAVARKGEDYVPHVVSIAREIGEIGRLWSKEPADMSVEETELDVGSASDELESSVAEPKLARRPTPRPFTIESLIGNAREDTGGGGIMRDDRTNGSEEEEHRDREYQLYQRHYLATAAASTLPSGTVIPFGAVRLQIEA